MVQSQDGVNRDGKTDPNIVLDEVQYEVLGSPRAQVAVISLNRPELLNPISGRPGGTRDQILHALSLANSDAKIGCVIIRGHGRAFSTGGDLTGNTRRETLEEHRAFLADASAFRERMRSSRLPTIAEVHGFCLGAGVLLAESCDLVIAAQSAQFGFPEGRLGLVGISPLTMTIGRQWAKFLMFTGELISAQKAQDLGLVLAVEADDALHNRVLDLAQRISRMPREGIALNRQAIDEVADASGEVLGRLRAIEVDAQTLLAADRATAPDGRTFRAIIETDGIPGMKEARSHQYLENWLRPSDNPEE